MDGTIFYLTSIHTLIMHPARLLFYYSKLFGIFTYSSLFLFYLENQKSQSVGGPIHSPAPNQSSQMGQSSMAPAPPSEVQNFSR